MKKQNLILSAALVAIFSASTAFAEAEVTGKIVHESAQFTTTGTTIGAATAHGKDAFKQETSARIYIDGAADELQDGATYHVELNLMKDGKATTNYDSNESYTQRDPLREAYIDSQVDDWSIRAGKQQVVWGTADGMKLLDMINPTDYGEMAQNQMEDSRIPVWMVNAETTDAGGSEYQVIVSQPKENVFSGLNRNISTEVRSNNADLVTDVVYAGQDKGNAFILMGPDTITGEKNGFLNIVPDLGDVSRQFSYGFSPKGTYSATRLNPFANFTVGGFEQMTMGQMNAAFNGEATNLSVLNNLNFLTSINGVFDAVSGNAQGTTAATNTTAATSITGEQMLQYGFAPLYGTNLTNYATATAVGSDTGRDAAFEYMDAATFKTFDTLLDAKSQYVYDMPSDGEVDLAIRTKRVTKDGVNYSLNASYNYDKNPIIDLSWRNASGGLLNTSYYSYGTGATATTSIMLHDAATGATVSSGGDDAPILRFTQQVKRVQNLGGSFDMAVETESFGPVVIRGEGLYVKGAYQPVIDRAKLAIGDMTGALTMVKGDRFKYVLGADVTVLTNMMVSAQFIQDRNLDYIDETSTPDTNNANVVAPKYTTDYATMHLTNAFNKAEENKEFYSLFLSKPFGASGEHRWNNIFMYEENDGNWNRFDAEFSIDDDTQATVEYNKYWGDANTQFGQLEKSSNIQVGVKYSF